MDIGIWGASITYGKGDEEGLGWPGRLRRLLNPTKEVDVYNRGICGNTSGDLLARLPSELASIRPDSVIVSIGMNDSKYRKGQDTNAVSLDMFRENVRSIIENAKGYTNRIALVGLTNVCSPLVTPSGSQFSDELVRPYDTVLRECAQGKGLPYLELFGMLDTETDFSDGLHPNLRGYEKVYERILPFLKQSGLLDAKP